MLLPVLGVLLLLLPSALLANAPKLPRKGSQATKIGATIKQLPTHIDEPTSSGFFNSHRFHLSNVLKFKCDALLTRSVFVEPKCFFAVVEKVAFTNASTQCSKIFQGSQVALDTPAEIFGKLMVDASEYHSSKDSGAKHTICYYETGYKCREGIKSDLLPGTCIKQTDTKMTVYNATKYCNAIGMEIPSIDNSLENRVVQRELVKDPAWVNLMYNDESYTNRKWRREKSYSTFTTCESTDKFIRSSTQKFDCNQWAMVAKIQKSGDWILDGHEAENSVVCVANAVNPFSPVNKSCLADHVFDELIGRCKAIPTTTTTTTTSATTTTTPYPCRLPIPVSHAFPSPFEKDANGGQLERRWGGKIFSCPTYVVGNNGNGDNSFTFIGGTFICDPATKKYLHHIGYAAPDFLSCAKTSSRIYGCLIKDQQESGMQGTITLYPGHEQYCPSNKVIKWMPEGRYVNKITCNKIGRNFKIETDDGVFTLVSDPVLTCVSAPTIRAFSSPCQLPLPVVQSFPSPFVKDANGGQLVRDGNTISCRSRAHFVGYNGNGKNTFTFGGGPYRCDVATKKWMYEGYTAPEFLSCGYNSTSFQRCGIYDLQESGKKGFISLYPGQEQYCPSNKVIKWMPHGRYVKQITCLGSNFKIVTDYGVFTLDNDPVFSCVKN